MKIHVLDNKTFLFQYESDIIPRIGEHIFDKQSEILLSIVDIAYVIEIGNLIDNSRKLLNINVYVS